MQPSLLGNVFCWSDQATLLRTLLSSVSSENQNGHDDEHGYDDHVHDDHGDDHDDGNGGDEMHA